jgi:hypothetical protein
VQITVLYFHTGSKKVRVGNSNFAPGLKKGVFFPAVSHFFHVFFTTGAARGKKKGKKY